MSKQKETPRNSVPNKRKIPAIYRKLEILTLDLTKRVDNIPNKPMLKEYICRLSNELVDCLASTRYAYSTQDYETRYEFLRDMEVHLELIKSIVNILFEYASTTSSRFMTPDHHAKYLLDLDDIERQRKNWADSTLKSLSATKSIAPTKDHLQAPERPPVTPDLDIDLSIPENAHFMLFGDDRVVNNFVQKADNSTL